MLRPNNVWEYLPGLKKALVVFGAYVVVDFGYQAVTGKKGGGHDDHGHGGHDDHGHGEEHHEGTNIQGWKKTVGTNRPHPVSTSARQFPWTVQIPNFEK